MADCYDRFREILPLSFDFRLACLLLLLLRRRQIKMIGVSLRLERHRDEAGERLVNQDYLSLGSIFFAVCLFTFYEFMIRTSVVVSADAMRYAVMVSVREARARAQIKVKRFCGWLCDAYTQTIQNEMQ